MAVDLAQKAQNFTNRGRQALETGRYELAVDMLMEAVSAAPDVLETRKLLRAALRPCPVWHSEATLAATFFILLSMRNTI